ncbi:Transcription initiation factor IIB [Colletotrichum tanaceti]|uniref:Transcription initiation factor IIB n=1 Tax=Colletotrichum tanaceti TaxID=1306861 RepID=A0A4U6XGK2_9PEZI|nr:Transcription initiation factor IIB [Colletotrichum tanaceti]
MSVALFYVFDRKKKAQFREACQRDPYLTRKEFARRRKLSSIERLEEEEMQRNTMIRKSLAGREPSRQNSCEDFDVVLGLQQHHHHQHHHHRHHRHQEPEERHRLGRQLSDEWMARTRSGSETSSSASSARDHDHRPYVEPHPGVEVEITLAPRPRTSSPSRTPVVRKPVPQSPAVPVMAELHSPLFVQLATDLLWTQTKNPAKEDPTTHKAVVNKRKELRRRRKELKRRRKVFDEVNNIYTAKPYTPKMLGPNGAATDENGNPEGFRDDLNMVVMCPDCKEYPPHLVEEFSSGDMVCGSCGLVVGERIIDTRSEWRTFANDDQGNDDPSRVGDAVNPLLNGSQLETTIAFGDGRDSKQLARLQNKSQNDKASKSLMQAYKEIGAFCDSINLGKNVSDAAKHIFKLTYDHNFMKGKPQEAVIAGCIFIACRQTGVGRTFREIFQVTHVSKKEIGRVFKQLESFLQKIKEENPRGAGSLSNLDGYKASASTSAEDLCTRFCSNLNFRNAQKIENVSRALARKTSSVSELAGRSPLSVAAACIYMASHLMKEVRTSKEIASVAGVSDGTIKTAYRFLYQARDRLIEKEWGADQKAIDGLPIN